ncbi:DUF1398 domain-containing protein [Spirosoma sp. KCTC 42546]|uniref:DUF1398 family protein n=1 Tax=Spirosoma sp. KCTC 42546 TaxID=2520506 RepID=UPI00115A82D9|nr:DUF1398 family protein [Spirosoma sp. KCTC 42546]QDK78904.1 DUF1398 domain-containing protein [Spirosoma sp. KCTC 42546]
MLSEESLRAAYATAQNYPDLAQKLVDAGVQSYTVEVSSGNMIYRSADGETLLHPTIMEPRAIATRFDQAGTIQAIRGNQEGKTDYPQFMNEIAQSGIRFYDAILTGNNKRVIYVGIGGHYEEKIPIV